LSELCRSRIALGIRRPSALAEEERLRSFLLRAAARNARSIRPSLGAARDSKVGGTLLGFIAR
jgi:hypothetical protein